MKGHTDVVYSLDFSHDGQVLGSGSIDGTVRIWNPNTNGTSGNDKENRYPEAITIKHYLLNVFLFSFLSHFFFNLSPFFLFFVFQIGFVGFFSYQKDTYLYC